MGIVIKKLMTPSTGNGKFMKAVATIISEPQDIIEIFIYDERGLQSKIITKKLYGNNNTRSMLLHWKSDDWVSFLRNVIHPFYGGGRYYVCDMGGARYIKKLFLGHISF